VLSLQALFEPITGGGTLAVAASTLLVAAAVQPLGRRVRSIVDRRFFRAHYDAIRTLDAFAARLRSEVDLRSIREDVASTVTGTVRPAELTVWIRAATSWPRTSAAAPGPEAASPLGRRNVPGPSTTEIS
jgi:hypothetical protein